MPFSANNSSIPLTLLAKGGEGGLHWKMIRNFYSLKSLSDFASWNHSLFRNDGCQEAQRSYSICPFFDQLPCPSGPIFLNLLQKGINIILHIFWLSYHFIIGKNNTFRHDGIEHCFDTMVTSKKQQKKLLFSH